MLLVELSFGEKLKAARLEAGLTQEAVAAASALSVTSIQNYEAETSKPRLSNIAAIAKAVGKPVSYFRQDGAAPEGRKGSLEADLRQQLLDAKEREFELRQKVWDIYQDFEILWSLVTGFPWDVDWRDVDRGSDEYAQAMQGLRDELERNYDWLISRFEEVTRREPRAPAPPRPSASLARGNSKTPFCAPLTQPESTPEALAAPPVAPTQSQDTKGEELGGKSDAGRRRGDRRGRPRKFHHGPDADGQQPEAK